MGDLSKDFLPTAIAWNFSGFACMQLKLNQFCQIMLQNSYYLIYLTENNKLK
jgi:hypothetical protein